MSKEIQSFQFIFTGQQYLLVGKTANIGCLRFSKSQENPLIIYISTVISGLTYLVTHL